VPAEGVATGPSSCAFFARVGIVRRADHTGSVLDEVLSNESVFQIKLANTANAYSYLVRFDAATIDPRRLWYYLGIRCAISLSGWIIGTSRYFSIIFVASIRASKVLSREACPCSLARSPPC